MVNSTDRPTHFLRLLGRVANLGLFVVASLLVGLFLGISADSALGLKGPCAVAGLLLGMAAGFREFYRIFADLAAGDAPRPADAPNPMDTEPPSTP